MLNKIINWIFDHIVLTCLSVLLFSFTIATIALAVDRNYYWDKYEICEKEKNDLLTSTTTITTTSTQAITTTKEPPERDDFRLDSKIVPTAYDILLYPNLESDTFIGEVKIVVQVFEERSAMVVHSHDLIIDSLELRQGETLIPTTYEYGKEIISISPESGNIGTATYILNIIYNANLTGDVGFYMSRLADNSKIATSKFEPTYARQAFPCFDEPAMKAKYTVRLVKPHKYIALSNMNEEKSEPYSEDGELDVVTFAESVPMSTYLACFIICNFTYIEANITQESRDFPLRVYATSESELDKVKFALDIGKRVTEYYIKYFDIEYPLPKLDMIGIPDFVSGAMEHWGLVTFRETALLYDTKTTSTATKQNIARVIAHEVSHMWFGNLVTMAWWDELWLNEGFASYMQYKALEELDNSWKTVEQFLSANTQSVMALDATLASHPIVVTVETPDEITAIFDSISYNKGAAILRMLEGFVGEDNFAKGITDYLNEHKYNNTVTQNLLDKLAVYFDAGDPPMNISHIMDTWTRQMGLPVVSISQGTGGQYTLTQKRFLADPDAVDETPSPFNYRWFIPITYTTKNGGPSNKIAWFSDTQDSITINVEPGDQIIKLNNDQVGYYRVNYPEAMWDTIGTELKNSKTLTPSDKANIISDVFSLAEAGLVSYSRALTVSQYLREETDNYAPWAIASSHFSTLNRIMSNSLAFVDFQKHVQKLLEKIVTKFGWESTGTEEPHIDKITRSTVLNMACAVGHDLSLKNATTRFSDWLEKNKEIDPDIKGTVYYYGVENSPDTEWMKFYDMFLKETDPQEKSRMMQALAATRNPARLKWYLQMAWDDSIVRSQDYFSVMQYISANPVGTPIVWDYFRENWDRIKDRFTLNSRVLGTTVPFITRTFATTQKLKEMENFFELNPEAGAGATARQQALEAVRNNIQWMEKREPAIREWLQASESKTK